MVASQRSNEQIVLQQLQMQQQMLPAQLQLQVQQMMQQYMFELQQAQAQQEAPWRKERPPVPPAPTGGQAPPVAPRGATCSYTYSYTNWGPSPPAAPPAAPPVPPAADGQGGQAADGQSPIAQEWPWLRRCRVCGEDAYWREGACLNPWCSVTLMKFEGGARSPWFWKDVLNVQGRRCKISWFWVDVLNLQGRRCKISFFWWAEPVMKMH